MKKAILIMALLAGTITGKAQGKDTTATKQCIGLTVKGLRCKRKIPVTTVSNYCYQHSAETDKKHAKVN